MEIDEEDDERRHENTKYCQSRRDKSSTPASLLGSADSEDSVKRNAAEVDSSSLGSDISLRNSAFNSQSAGDLSTNSRNDLRNFKSQSSHRRLSANSVDVNDHKNETNLTLSKLISDTGQVNSMSPNFVNDKKSLIGNVFKESNACNDKVNSSLNLTNRTQGAGNTSQITTNQDILSPSQVNLSNLPKLISHLANTHGLPDLSGLSPQATLKTIQQALQLTKQVKQRSASQAISNVHRSASSNSPLNNTPAQSHGTVRESPSSGSLHSRQHSSQSHLSHFFSRHFYHHHHPSSHHHSSSHRHSSHHSSQTQPHYQPHQQSYSHHQSADGIRHELDLLTNKNWAKSPGSENSVDSPTRGPNSSVSSNIPGSISSSSLKPSLPTLTPSLANYFREDLIGHVIGWQADHAERQVKMNYFFF